MHAYIHTYMQKYIYIEIPLFPPLVNQGLSFKDPDHRVSPQDNPFPCDS